MAMIPCRECRKVVSDAAPACPHCGVTSPGGVTELEISRVKRIQTSQVPMVVAVDYEYVATLGSGESIVLKLLPGRHRIECRMEVPLAKSCPLEVDLLPGRRLVATVSPSWVTGKVAYSQNFT